MTKLHSLLSASALMVSLGLLSACAGSTPPPTPTVEPMRGAALPAPERVPTAGGNPSISTEPMRGGPSSTATSTVRRGGPPPTIGTEPMRGGPLPSSTDQSIPTDGTRSGTR